MKEQPKGVVSQDKIYKVEEFEKGMLKVKTLTTLDTKEVFFFGIVSGARVDVVRTPMGDLQIPHEIQHPFPIEAKSLEEAFCIFIPAFEKFKADMQKQIVPAPAGAIPQPLPGSQGPRKGGNGPVPGGIIQLGR